MGRIASAISSNRVPGWAIFLLGVTCVLPAAGQSAAQPDSLGFAVSDTVRVGPSRTIQLQPFLIQGSVRLERAGIVLETGFEIDHALGRVSVPNLTPGTEVIASYRVLLLDVPVRVELNREPLIDNTPSASGRRRAQAGPPTSGTLRSRGSISRGIIAGSNRDVAVESGLRLELDGELAPGLGIRATLSDADSPIRPDGSTQRLSEFDRVFVEMTAQSGRVVLGDFDGRLVASRFANLNRKLQGVMISSAFSTAGDGMDVRVSATGASSRGTFQSQIITPQDGVQGPYRLQGAQGERFVLVLPGSEQVFLDGRLLSRGEAEDYVLDYSLGEITFTSRNVIGADSRITVEFQYSTNQFTRTLVASEFDIGFGRAVDANRRFSVGASWLREADSGEFLSEFGLTATDSLLLSQAGDAGASRTGATRVPYDPEARYAQYEVESMGQDSIFVVLTARPPDGTPVYRVQFSRLGEGEGSYDRVAQSLNGIAYQFVGEGSGAYAPVRLLPTPRLKSVMDFRAAIRPTRGISISGELARSINDQNRLSSRDEGDDEGSAFQFALSAETPGTELGKGALSYTASRVSSNFSTFERFREIEFGRRWNLDATVLPAIGTSSLGGRELEQAVTASWSVSDSIRSSVTAARLDLAGTYLADRLEGRLEAAAPGRPSILVTGTRVRSDDRLNMSEGSWHNVAARLTDGREAVQVGFDLDYEDRSNRVADTLSAASIRYLELRPFIMFERTGGEFSASLERRTESWPQVTQLASAATSWTASTRAATRGREAVDADLELAWRTKTIRDGFRATPGANDTRALLLKTTGSGRSDWASINWLYDARTERIPVLQEIYLRAGPELGAYVWVDENGDDAVQVDELLPETTPNEGTYIRTFLPSDSLAAVNSVRVRMTGRFRPPSTGSSPVTWSARTVAEVQEQSRSADRLDIYLLRLNRFRTPGLTTSGRIRVRQDASVLHTASGFSLDAVFQEHRAMNELSSGIESRQGRLTEAQLGFRPTTTTRISLKAALERDRTDSDRFASRNFDVVSRSLRPAVVIRTPAAVYQGAIEFARKEDAFGDRTADVFRMPLSVRWVEAGKADILTRFEVSRVTINGPPAVGLAEFELTDGRGAGTAFLWGITAQWSLSRTLRATVAYDGRAPSGRRVIHTGRVQMSAIF